MPTCKFPVLRRPGAALLGVLLGILPLAGAPRSKPRPRPSLVGLTAAPFRAIRWQATPVQGGSLWDAANAFKPQEQPNPSLQLRFLEPAVQRLAPQPSEALASGCRF